MLEAIRDVLVTNGLGQPHLAHRLVASQNWDEIRTWSDKVYMPYRVTPLGRAQVPDSALDATPVGHLTLSRFKYGIPVNIQDFSPEAGTGMILTTLSGAARHWLDRVEFADTAVGDAFVVDNSRAHYRVDFADNHLQVNLTFRHDQLAEFHQRWFGEVADDRLWRLKFKFGGARSTWTRLLAYACQCVNEIPHAVSQGPLGKHLEEMICAHILTEWRQRLQAPCGEQAGQRYALAPRHVLIAERYIEQHARTVPTLSEIAAAAGVSVRTLSQAFRAYRNTTPKAVLYERRLQGVRSELLLAHPHRHSVGDIARTWGYSNLGLFARNYRHRFGELPSETLPGRH